MGQWRSVEVGPESDGDDDAAMGVIDGDLEVADEAGLGLGRGAEHEQFLELVDDDQDPGPFG